MHLCEKSGDIDVKGVFESALDALGTLSRKKVDFLLLDIEMPELTGVELIRMMDQIPQVIITSSKEEYAVEAFELADKVLDYLVKPVNPKELIQAVNTASKQLERDQTELKLNALLTNIKNISLNTWIGILMTMIKNRH